MSTLTLSIIWNSIHCFCSSGPSHQKASRNAEGSQQWWKLGQDKGICKVAWCEGRKSYPRGPSSPEVQPCQGRGLHWDQTVFLWSRQYISPPRNLDHPKKKGGKETIWNWLNLTFRSDCWSWMGRIFVQFSMEWRFCKLDTEEYWCFCIPDCHVCVKFKTLSTLVLRLSIFL